MSYLLPRVRDKHCKIPDSLDKWTETSHCKHSVILNFIHWTTFHGFMYKDSKLLVELLILLCNFIC